MAVGVSPGFDERMHDASTTSTHIDIGRSRISHRIVGDGPDLLFVHGWPLNRETWRDVAAALRDFRCHLIDLPGCGTTITRADTAVSMDGHVDAVVAAIERLGLDAVTLVGQDSGGLVARKVAARLPDVVNGLVLCGTEIPGEHPKFIDRLQTALKIPGVKAVTRSLLRQPRTARSPQLLGGLFWDRDLIEGEFRTVVLAPTLDDPGVFDRQIEILQSYRHELVDSLADDHALIACPTLLAWGEHDPFFPVETARRMVDGFGGPVAFEVIANARLLAHEEHPRRFAELMRTFLRDQAIVGRS